MKYKLFGRLMVSVIILLSLFGMTIAEASEDKTNNKMEENLIINPGFEEMKDGIPIDWTAKSNDWESEGLKPHSDAAYTGDFGIKMEARSGEDYWIRQTIPIEGGATYELATWVKEMDSSSRFGARMKVEYYHDTTDADGYVDGRHINTDDLPEDWTKISDEFTVPDEANKMQIYLRLYGPGLAFYDDVSLIKTQPAPAVFVSTDQFFYYTDIEEGTVHGIISPEDGIYEDKTVDVNIVPTNGGDPILQEEGLPAEKDFSYSFDPRPMNPQEPYDIKLILKSDKDETLYTNKETIYRWERPTSIRKDGTLEVEGKPFFPRIGYHVSKRTYERASETINTIQGHPSLSMEGMKADLDRAEKQGIKVLVNLYGHNMKVRENFELTKRKVETFKDHPALLGWMVMDEPFGNGISNEELKEAYILIRGIDPVHPTYIVENSSGLFEETGKVTDVLATDPYPLRYPDEGKPITTVGEHVKLAKEAVHNEKPVWNLLQAFDYGPDSNYPYLPNITELRNMAYQSVLEGAKGLGYYSFDDEEKYGWFLPDSDLYPKIKEFTKKEIPYISDFVLSGEKINSYQDDYVQWGLWEREGKLYATVINLTEEAQEITVFLPGHGYQISHIAPEIKQSSIYNNELNLELSELEATLFQLTPFTSSVDMKKLVEEFEDKDAFNSRE